MNNKERFYIYILSNRYFDKFYLTITKGNFLLDAYKKTFLYINYYPYIKKYKIYYLLYFESYNNLYKATKRIKQLKAWNISKKRRLISKFNKNLVNFLFDFGIK